jgi:hypothetical protein
MEDEIVATTIASMRKREAMRVKASWSGRTPTATRTLVVVDGQLA